MYTSYSSAYRKHFKRPQTISPKTNFVWGSDVAYMLPYRDANNGYAYFVVFVDIFSRYAYAQPLKDLKARSMLEAMQLVFASVQPKNLFTDSGVEYTNRIVQRFLNIKSINHYVSRNEKKVAHAERLIKQLNRKLAQYMNHTNSNIWINVLQDIFRAYNISYHHSIQMTPNDARKPENNFKVWDNQYN